MAIKIQQHLFTGLDGGPTHVAKNVGYQIDVLDPHGGVGQAIDFALAAVFEFAEDGEQAQEHLGYIIDQLSTVGRNMRESGA